MYHKTRQHTLHTNAHLYAQMSDNHEGLEKYALFDNHKLFIVYLKTLHEW